MKEQAEVAVLRRKLVAGDSDEACKEYMSEINQVLFHLYMMLYGIDAH